MPANNGSKKALDTKVICSCGFCDNTFFITGTAIATSPIAEKRMVSMCDEETKFNFCKVPG